MKTLVAGMGVSGLETARFLERKGWVFETFDEQKTAEQLQSELPGFNVCHHRELPDLANFELVVTSPGMALTHPLLVRATELNCPIWSEIELAWRFQKGRVIALTGSNGKSTTVSLIHHLLKENGIDSWLCGNIGTPFIACVNEDPNRVYVIEVSSFQLEHVHQFRPHIGLLLNVAPDHLDRHGDLETYRGLKLSLFSNQQPDDVAFCDPDHLNRLPGRGRAYAIPGSEIHLDEHSFCLESEFRVSQELLPLLGSHNRMNALFAIAAVREVGLDQHQIGRALQSFQGLEHRMEKVGVLEGRLWINDSKATNVHAANAALTAMDQPFVLILGGSGKGGGFTDLDFSRRQPRAVIAYGQTAQRICQDIAALNPIHVADFRDACLKAHQLAEPGDAILMSPACASFDQFNNYMHRGKVFKEFFRTLEGRL